MANIIAIIPAAGTGSRMNTKIKKQYLLLKDQPVISHTITVMEECSDITGIVLVVGPGEEELCKSMLLPRGFRKVMAVVPGGDHRQTSVLNGLQSLPQPVDFVAIHDGARPLVKHEDISKVIQAAKVMGAAALAVPVKDTVKMVDEAGIVISTPPRDRLWSVQTPQVFSYELILRAHLEAQRLNTLATDDCALVEALGHPVQLIAGSYDNIKITTQEDLILAEAVLSGRGNT